MLPVVDLGVALEGLGESIFVVVQVSEVKDRKRSPQEILLLWRHLEVGAWEILRIGR